MFTHRTIQPQWPTYVHMIRSISCISRNLSTYRNHTRIIITNIKLLQWKFMVTLEILHTTEVTVWLCKFQCYFENFNVKSLFKVNNACKSINVILRGYCNPGQFCDCAFFLKNYSTFLTSKICFLIGNILRNLTSALEFH